MRTPGVIASDLSVPRRGPRRLVGQGHRVRTPRKPWQFARLLSRPFPPRRVVVLSLLCALLVTLPELAANVIYHQGYFADDFMQLCAWRGCASPGGPTLDHLFRFASGDPSLALAAMQDGSLPWYADPTMKINLWRPLSGLLHRFDYQVFDGALVAAKLHGVAWYLALVGAVASLYLQVLPTRVAALGAVVFALAGAHYQAAMWVAARNALVASALGMCAVGMYIGGRRRSIPALVWSSPLLYVIALSAGEVGLGSLPFLLLYEWWCPAPTASVRRRWAPAGLWLALTFGWLVAYKLGGFGATQSEGYYDPLGNPLQFLAAMPRRVLGLLSMGYLGFPSELWLMFPQTQPVAIGLGAFALAFVVVAARAAWRQLNARERQVLLWLATASLPATVLQSAGGGLGGRSLTLPSVGMAAVIALLMTGSYRAIDARHTTPGSTAKWRRRWHRAVLVSLAAIHLLVAPASWAANTAFYHPMISELKRVTEPALEEAVGKTAIVLQAPSVFMGEYLPFERRSEGRPGPVAWRALSVVPAAHQVTRTSATQLQLAVVGGRWLDTPLEKVQRSADAAFEVGDQVDLGDMRVTVQAVDERKPTRIAVDFDRPLEDDSLIFFAWGKQGLSRFELPPIGGNAYLPWYPSVL